MTNDQVTNITYGYTIGKLKQNLFICKQLGKVKWLTNNAVLLHKINFILPHIKLHEKSTKVQPITPLHAIQTYLTFLQT